MLGTAVNTMQRVFTKTILTVNTFLLLKYRQKEGKICRKCSKYIDNLFVNIYNINVVRKKKVGAKTMAVNYGYARCSTNEEKQDIERQIRELIQQGVERENIYLEYESGTKVDRIEWNRLIGKLQEGDTITSLEVSRITRSTKQLLDIIEMVKERRLKLSIVGSITVDCTAGEEIDPMTKAFLQIAGVFAELERNMISQRVKSGMANAAAEGRKAGRPHTSLDDIPSVFMKHYPKYKKKEINVTEFARLCGMSRTTIYKYVEMMR